MYVTTAFVCAEGMPEELYNRIRETVVCPRVGMRSGPGPYLSAIFFNATQKSVDQALVAAVRSGCIVERFSEQDIKTDKDVGPYVVEAYSLRPPRK